MRILLALILLILLACSNKSKSSEKKTVNLSFAQNRIQGIVDSFKIEFNAANSQALEDSITMKYNHKLFDYFDNNYIDSIRVHVDKVFVDSLTVHTEFHCNNDIAFKYGLTFTKNMAPDEDSLFKFMKGLVVGSDTTVTFAYMGSHMLNNPRDSSLPTLRIFAFPVKAKNYD